MILSMELDIDNIQPIIDNYVVPIASATILFIVTLVKIWVKAKKKGA